MAVRTGLEVLLADGATLLRGKRIGIVCNQASIGPRFEHVVDALGRQPMVRIGALLGPEHGVRGEAQDMIPVAEGGVGGNVDPRSGAPVHSLYGDSFESLTPTPAMLEGLDTLVFDMQDVGARYYTFYATMVLCMRAAAKAGVSFVVLDRPNPLGGEAIEGGLHEGPRYLSFVGLFPLPVRHGMTVGEIAAYANDVLEIGCDLTVVRMEGWNRAMQWEETGLPFIPPSPNMPTADTARVYPGTCLVEGTNLSEGRGTTRPFEQNGAPFYDPEQMAGMLNAMRLPGVYFRPCWFQPTFHKFAMQGCAGAFIHVTDKRTFLPYRSGLAFIEVARKLAPYAFKWRTERYEFVDDVPAFDLLVGTDQVRRSFDAGEGITALLDVWKEQEAQFAKDRAPYLLY